MKTFEIKIKGYEQIPKDQYLELQNKEKLKVLKDNETNIYYFKKTGKLEENLKNFENEKMAIKLFGDGMEIINKTDKRELFLGYTTDFGVLVKATKNAEKIAEKYQNENK